MLLFRELAVCWDTIQSLCGDINVTLSFELAALLWYYTIIVWWYYCYFAVWIGSLAVILYNHCIVILMLLWPWIGSFAVILYNHFVVILKLLCRLNWQLYCDTIKALCGDIKITLPFELAAFLWYNTIIVQWSGDDNVTLPWIGSFAMILYNHCVVILMLLCCELAALLWYYTIIVWWY